MKNFKIIWYFLFIYANSFAQINYGMLEEIDAKVKVKYGNDIIVNNYFVIDSIAIHNLNYPVADKVIDYDSILSGKILFTATKNDSSISRKGIVGIYENNAILWDSDTSINCNDVDLLNLYSTFDLNRDGYIDIAFSATELGIQAGTERLYIYSWDGTSCHLISNLNNDDISEIVSLTGVGEFDYVDVNGDGIYEVLGKWYLPDDNINEKIVTYYWDGINYSFNPTNPQPQTITFLPQDAIEANINAKVTINDSLFTYHYLIYNHSSSIQEINEVYFEKLADSLNFLGVPQNWDHFLYFDLIGFEDFHFPTLGYYHNNFIKINSEDSSIAITSYSLPSFIYYYIQGYNREPLDSILTQFDYYNNIKSNSVNGYTIGPKDIDSIFIAQKFLDTLINYTNHSFELGWITNQTTEDKYDSLFSRAKTLLEGGYIPWVDSTLHSVLVNVDEDSSGNITSEAYALIRYNTEFLLANLPEVTAPIINSISPQLAMPYYATPIEPNVLTITITGQYFTDSTVAYYNGYAKPTTFVSDSVITISLNSINFPAAGNYPIWVSNYGSVSDTMFLSVVNSLPGRLMPTLQCVVNNPNKTYTAHFGYNNENTIAVGIVGRSDYNYFTPGDRYRGQPNIFLPGNHSDVFSTVFDGTNLYWVLSGGRIVANKYLAPCD